MNFLMFIFFWILTNCKAKHKGKPINQKGNKQQQQQKTDKLETK